MICEVLFFYNNDVFINITQHISSLSKPYQVITSNYLLNELLKENNINSKTLREMFPEEGEITYHVYKSAKETQKFYADHFKEINFHGYNLFAGIENQILDQIILLEKARKILEQKEATIFIFEGFSFTYFAISKLAESLGYEVSVGEVQNNGIKHLKYGKNQRIYEYKNKIRLLRSIYFPKLSINKKIKNITYRWKTRRKEIPLYKLSINKKIKNITYRWKTRRKEIPLYKSVPLFIVDCLARVYHLSIRAYHLPIRAYHLPIRAYHLPIRAYHLPIRAYHLFARLSSFMTKLFTFRILAILGKDINKTIIKKVDSKILDSNVGYNAECIFCFTTNQEDLYLKALYPVLDRLSEEGIKFQIFTIDLITESVLVKRGIPFINLFDEVNILSDNLRNSQRQIKNIGKKIEKMAIDNNLYLLHNDELSHYFWNEINRSIAIMDIFGHIFKQMKVKSVVIATDGTMFGNSVINTSRKQKISSFFIPSAHINPNPLHADWFKADKICIYGLQGVEVLTNLGYEKNRILLTGTPKYDYIKNTDPKKSKLILESSYQIDSQKKLITIGMARWHKNDGVWMSELIKFCNKNNFEIVIKIHPLYKVTLHDESENEIKIISDMCKGLRYFIFYDIDLPTLLSAADLVITEYSNVGAEAILLDKPLIIVNFIKEEIANNDFKIFSEASVYLEEYDKIENVILDIMNNKKHTEELAAGRRKISDMWNYRNDGKATQRICDLLLRRNRESMITANEIL